MAIIRRVFKGSLLLAGIALLLAGALLLLLVLVVINGPGGSDFVKPIDDRYAAYRNNSFDMGIATLDGMVITESDADAGIGPLYAYAETDSFIYCKHYGSAYDVYNVDGDPHYVPVADCSRTWYFEIDKSSGAAAGPFTAVEFNARTETEVLDWETH